MPNLISDNTIFETVIIDKTSELYPKSKASDLSGIISAIKPTNVMVAKVAFLYYLCYIDPPAAWEEWGKWRCRLFDHGNCMMFRTRECSTGTDCGAGALTVGTCNQSVCPGKSNLYVFQHKII